MWTPAAEVGFLLAAGVAAGIASSSGAIGSLIAYPALLLVGLPPVVANTTSTVGVVGVVVGSSLRSRDELAVTRHLLPRTVVCGAAGAVSGAVLLLHTPGDAFRWIVPFLIAVAAALMLAQPRITRARGHGPALLLPGLFLVTAYEGYFGAGAGVMTLALVLLTVDTTLPVANALKNVLLGVADLVAGVLFVIFGTVSWLAAVPLALGFAGGGTIGPSIVRWVRPQVLRAVIATAAFGLAAVLLVDAARG